MKRRSKARSKSSPVEPMSSRMVSSFSTTRARKREIEIVVGGEVMHHDIARLSVTIETTVALLKAGGIPRNVPVQEVARRLLQVETFGRRIGGEEHAHLRGGIVERGLDVVPRGIAHVAGKREDRVVVSEIVAQAARAGSRAWSCIR